METVKSRFEPVRFAVIKSRTDGVVKEMAQTVLRTSRNPLLYSVNDFTCVILTRDAKLLNMIDSLPIHLLSMGTSLEAVIEYYRDDLHPGDCFLNSDPYHGSSHIGDWEMFAPVFYEGELICWVGSLCHQIDVGAYIATSCNPHAKDIHEEGMHFPPMRIARNHKEIAEFVRFVKANFRSPEEWYGDLLAQFSSLWRGEQKVVALCKKYGSDVFKQFQDELLDYGDRRMTEEISKLPKGTWSIEAVGAKMETVSPEGPLLKLKMSIDPDEAVITFDLTEMPDQLPWGLNVGEASARSACIEGSLPAFDPTLPRNEGVFRHFNVILREGAVCGKLKLPAASATSTFNTTDDVSNMVLTLWEQCKAGWGHGAGGQSTPQAAWTSVAEELRGNAHLTYLGVSGGGASKGCDGWPGFGGNHSMGNMSLESIELVELKLPCLVWEVSIATDSGGPGKWRGAPGNFQRMQPRHQPMLAIPVGMGQAGPPGVTGGKSGGPADQWIEKHATREKTRQLRNIDIFHLKEDEDWVTVSQGGGGYGDPLERDPEAVRHDARNYIISVKAARDEYGVVLNTEPELYEVDYDATERLRTQLGNERRMK